jgi:hypothetical protein
MTTFACRIKPTVQAELDAAAAAETQGQFYTAFQHLERAHVLGQPATVEHVRVPAGGHSVARAGRGHAIALRRVSATFAFAGLAALTTLGLGGCSTPPKDLDIALEKQSAAGVYRVALMPPAQAPAINQMHSWKVKLATPDGTPVHGATFAVDGGMPQHGHGLPTQPRVTRELTDGTYQLDGMKFSMTGWWEVKLAIQGPQGLDKVTFNTVVDTPKVRQ